MKTVTVLVAPKCLRIVYRRVAGDLADPQGGAAPGLGSQPPRSEGRRLSRRLPGARPGNGFDKGCGSSETVREIGQAALPTRGGTARDALEAIRLRGDAVQDHTPGRETEFPHGIGKVAKRERAFNGHRRYEQLTEVTRATLLKIHGVGPKAVRILGEELARRGRSFAGDAP